MRLGSLGVIVFLVIGFVLGFFSSSLINIYTTTIVNIVRETETLETYVTVKETVTIVKYTTIVSLREEVTRTVTSTIVETVWKTTKDADISCIVFKSIRDVYKPSEEVVFVLENRCDYVLRLSNSAPWLITDAQGRIVFSPIALQVITDVRPGESIEWTWDQRDNDGRQVTAGTYYVKLMTMNAGMHTAEFKIVMN